MEKAVSSPRARPDMPVLPGRARRRAKGDGPSTGGPGIRRKLAAILAADVHQFSRLMGEDEAGTLADLQACFQIIGAVIAEHHGRIFGSAGDSVVAEFASAVSAVLCATECQEAIAARNALASSVRRAPSATAVARSSVNSACCVASAAVSSSRRSFSDPAEASC